MAVRNETQAEKIRLLKAALRTYEAAELTIRGLYLQLDEVTVDGLLDALGPQHEVLHRAVNAYIDPPTSYESCERNDDAYNRCNTEAAFISWLNDCGWKDAETFERDTGVTFEEIRGQWFNVTHNRVSTL